MTSDRTVFSSFKVRDQEKEESFFTEMPASNIFVIANLILDVATVDIEKADEVRTVLKDIWDIRQVMKHVFVLIL